MTLQSWYESLPANQQKGKKESIMFLLGVGNTMFYRTISGNRKFNPAEKQALIALAETDLDFGDEPDLTENLNLKKA